jgi:hypothetical protein
MANIYKRPFDIGAPHLQKHHTHASHYGNDLTSSPCSSDAPARHHIAHSLIHIFN